MKIKRANFSLLELIGYPKECGLLGSFFGLLTWLGKKQWEGEGGLTTMKRKRSELTHTLFTVLLESTK